MAKNYQKWPQCHVMPEFLIVVALNKSRIHYLVSKRLLLNCSLNCHFRAILKQCGGGGAKLTEGQTNLTMLDLENKLCVNQNRGVRQLLNYQLQLVLSASVFLWHFTFSSTRVILWPFILWLLKICHFPLFKPATKFFTKT